MTGKSLDGRNVGDVPHLYNERGGVEVPPVLKGGYPLKGRRERSSSRSKGERKGSLVGAKVVGTSVTTCK